MNWKHVVGLAAGAAAAAAAWLVTADPSDATIWQTAGTVCAGVAAFFVVGAPAIVGKDKQK